jgi:hypothetical protein
LQEAAQRAIDVQDACNLSGVIVRFREVVIDALWPAAARKEEGTGWVNGHPIAVLFAFKIASLAGVEPINTTNLERYREAVQRCQTIASGCPGKENSCNQETSSTP